MEPEEDAGFPCPNCGDPMTPGEIGIAGAAASRVAWRDVDGGEPGAPGTLYFQPHAHGDALVRPGLICRPCESVFVDFHAEHRAVLGSAPATFDERVRNVHGDVDLDALVNVLREGEPRACSRAVQAFVDIGAPAIPLLRQLTEDEDPDVRVDAAKALQQIEGT